MASPTTTLDGIEFRLVDALYFEARGSDGNWSPSGDSAKKVAGLARLLGFVHPTDARPDTSSEPVVALETGAAADAITHSDIADALTECANVMTVALSDTPRIHRNLLLRPHVVTRWRDALVQLAEVVR